MNVLLVDSSSETRDMLRFGLQTEFFLDIQDVATCEDAITRLDQFKANRTALDILKQANAEVSARVALEGKTQFDVIFCSFGSDLAKLTTWLKENQDRATVIVWNQTSVNLKTEPERVYAVLHAQDVLPELKEAIRRLIQDRGIVLTPKRENTLDEMYCPIRTPLLIKVSPLKSNIFLRLSEKKYLKVFPEGETFDRDDLQKYYEEKGVEFLYLKKDETSEFLDKFQSDLNALMDKPEISVTEASEAAEEAHETVQQMLHRTGFTEEVKEVARTAVMVTVKSMGDQPELMQILETLQRDRDKYITSHSILTAHLACAISAGMTWNSSATYEKLTLAAFMHDVTLTNQKLAEVESLQELKQREHEFSEDDIKLFRNHPMDASNLVRSMNRIPADVDVVVNQHHERSDGSGFPRGLVHTHIGHLSCVFIIGHELAKFMLRNPGKKEPLTAFVDLHKDRFSKGNFRKVLQSMVAQNEPPEFE